MGLWRKGGEKMIINPFLAGVLATLFVELVALFTGFVVYFIKTRKK